MKFPFIFLATTATTFAALLSVGPDYIRPAAPAPEAFRDEAAGWKTADPADALARGEWWKSFADPALDALITRALVANQDLHAAAARVEQARAAAGLARSDSLPQLALAPSFDRSRSSTTVDNVPPQTMTGTTRAPLVASWELDLFGRVRRLSESALADAEASAALFEAVRLSLSAEVAANYFSLRAVDRELHLMRDTIELRRRAFNYVTTRFRTGAATELDALRAETELASTEAETAAVGNRRASLQNAIAVLVGEPASAFSLEPRESDRTPAFAALPVIPTGLPSALLERRPDIAAAERALAAANARIGVAKAAFFPAISLTGSAGYASAEIDRLFTADSRAWSFGPSLYLPVFQGGRNRANLERSRAVFEENVALFRQNVLVAFREVQDALTTARFLAEQADAQDRALATARRAAVLAQMRYDAGYVAYIEVIDAQRTALSIERTSTQLSAQRLTARVALIKALGGGWSASLTVNPALAAR